LYDGNALMCVGPDGTLNGNHDTVHWFYCAGSIHGFIRGDRSEIAYAYVGQHYRLRIGTYDLGLGDGTAWLLGSDARLPLPENVGLYFLVFSAYSCTSNTAVHITLASYL
jgi:hypothetical protein